MGTAGGQPLWELSGQVWTAGESLGPSAIQVVAEVTCSEPRGKPAVGRWSRLGNVRASEVKEGEIFLGLLAGGWRGVGWPPQPLPSGIFFSL